MVQVSVPEFCPLGRDNIRNYQYFREALQQVTEVLSNIVSLSSCTLVSVGESEA